MSEISISVIIPVYNAELFLNRCLDSVLGQTLADIEVICVNDGSKDRSLEMLRQYQERYKNLVVIDQENAGPSAARNAGMALAKGKYIAFVDSDDYVERDMYESMFVVAEKNELNVVMCTYINDYAAAPSVQAVFPLPDGCVLNKQQIRELVYPELMKDGIFNGPCNKIYRRDFLACLDTKMPENLRYGEDLIFQLEIFDKLEKTYYIDKPFYHYVHRENSLSTAHTDMLESTLVPMYRIRRAYAAKWSLPLSKVAEYFVYYSLMDLVNSVRAVPVGKKWKKLFCYLRNEDFAEAINNSDLLNEGYTIKIRMLYAACRLLCKK